MTSFLKRKRGPVEAGDSSKPQKTAKKTTASTTKLESTEQSWDTAFMQGHDNKALTKVTQQNGEETGLQQSQNYEDYVQQQREAEGQGKQTRSKKPQWRISTPIGGRIISTDPIFSKDEKFLIIGHRTSLQIYSTADSLLNRSIKLDIDYSMRPATTRIVAFCLSPTNADLLWVACSDGAVYLIDWKQGSGTRDFWMASSTGISRMTVAAVTSKGRVRDVVYTTERRREEGGFRITAHELTAPGSSVPTVARTIYTCNDEVQILKVSDGGDVIVGAAKSKVVIGNLKTSDFGSTDKISYEFRTFDSPDYIGSLDVRISERGPKPDAKASKADRQPVVDVVVGDVRGVIFLHRDLLAQLIRAQTGQSKPGISLAPTKMHWHRNAVHAIKWSLDGNYLISGGSETALVIWQLDTGKKQFLPHLSATIDNIVVSPTGTSYAIHLTDNSVMVISTTELKPTSHVAGVQAHVIESTKSLESRVTRLSEETFERPLVQRIPSAINPSDPSRLLLAVGEKQEVNPFSTVLLNTPFLQTFDIASNRHISRQALARTNISNNNFAPDTFRISEPQTTHMKVSNDGSWLATVDVWEPPRRDLEHLDYSGGNTDDERHRRREVHLKFWQFKADDGTWELVSRIDAPHSLAGLDAGAGRILDLVASPTAHMFATIGEDRTIRTWIPKTRTRDGVVVKDASGEALQSWKQRNVTSLGKIELDDQLSATERSNTQDVPHGCVSFSDDGSMLAAAISGTVNGRVVLIDANAGSVHQERTGMYQGDILQLELTQQYLITVSTELRVYDLVQDELAYGIKLGDAMHLLSLEQKREMVHLAVDRAHSSFAVALPFRFDWKRPKTQIGSIQDACSELAVFSLNRGTPVFSHDMPGIVTTLLPSEGTAGYVVVDTHAEISVINPKSSQDITAMARSMVDQRLDGPEETLDKENGALVLADQADEDDGGDEEMLDSEIPGSDAAPVDEDDDGPPVVTQQQLTNVFDIGPSFALPPLETLFYQVADLFSVKPLPRQEVTQ